MDLQALSQIERVVILAPPIASRASEWKLGKGGQLFCLWNDGWVINKKPWKIFSVVISLIFLPWEILILGSDDWFFLNLFTQKDEYWI